MIDPAAHVERQLGSARRLLEILIAQTHAIGAQDIPAVLARIGDVQQEMGRRALLEQERDQLIGDVAARRGCDPAAITLEQVVSDLPAAVADRIRGQASELRRVLVEVGRVHAQNRVLVSQELRFLDQLVRVLAGTPDSGYASSGARPSAVTQNLVDTRA